MTRSFVHGRANKRREGISARIKERRAALGLSQERCAGRADFTRDTWRRAEEGQPVGFDIYEVMAVDVLKCDIRWLIFGEDYLTPESQTDNGYCPFVPSDLLSLTAIGG